MTDKYTTSFNLLKDYCEREEFKGWDPYDGLNSSFFQSFSKVRENRIARLIWIQLFKKSPLNLRKTFKVKKDFNPKGLGLFLSGYCNLYKMDPRQEYVEKISFLTEKILSLQSKGWSGSCWGYNFDWQARAFFQPKFTPTVVASTFIGYALLDAYDILQDEKLLKTARSVCDFILKDLNRTYDTDGNFAFSYSPGDSTQVFNASLLGVRLLSRVYSYTKEEHLITEAQKAVAFCVRHQQTDGSWAYGTLPFHQWVDNFHTGYNLECIYEYQKYSSDKSYEKAIAKGLDYYLATFFTKKGIPKYYNNSIYPIDIHAPAQLVITLSRLDKLKEHVELADTVLSWTIQNMQSEKGYFYFQKTKLFTSKIPYMRWAQGWMFYALTSFLLHFSSQETGKKN